MLSMPACLLCHCSQCIVAGARQDAQSALAQQLEARTGEVGQLREEVARLRMALVDAELDLQRPRAQAQVPPCHACCNSCLL